MRTGDRAHDRIQRELEQVGIFLLRTGQGKRHWVLQCSCCNETGAASLPLAYPTEAVAKKFRSMGWEIGKGPPAHSKCLHEAKQEKKVATQKIGPDPKIARKIYGILDDFFDEKAGAYKMGKTDESIARDLGVSVAIVSAIREEAYGPLKEDPRVAAIRQEIERLRVDIKDADDSIRILWSDTLRPLQERLRDLENSIVKSGIQHNKAAG